jgi:hypothetical protein
MLEQYQKTDQGVTRWKERQARLMREEQEREQTEREERSSLPRRAETSPAR